MSYAQTEARAIERIGAILCKLDRTCHRIEATDSKLFFEQEKAIHEIRWLIHETQKADMLEERQERHTRRRLDVDFEKEDKALAEIADRFDKLEITLDKPDFIDSRTKGYFEQRKALHEVKRILYYMGIYDKYNEKELEEICC